MHKSLYLMGYNVLIDDLSVISIDNDKKQIINTINPHSYVMSKKDQVFRKALLESDKILPDGSGIVLAAKYIKGKHINKISGSDLHIYLLEKLNKIHGKVFYMGSSWNTLKKIKERIHKEYNNIKVEVYSPPFKEQFSDEDNKNIINQINNFNPDVLFVGLTAPKQEKWLFEHKNLLNFKVASSIGAAFDFYAGTIERSSQFWIDRHLEWLPRLIQEPKRLWKRNFISTPLFLADMIKCKITSKSLK